MRPEKAAGAVTLAQLCQKGCIPPSRRNCNAIRDSESADKADRLDAGQCCAGPATASAAGAAGTAHPRRLQLQRLLPCPPTSLQLNGAPQPMVTLRTVERGGQAVDLTVAAQPLRPGDLALRVPDRLAVTLDRVLEDT